MSRYTEDLRWKAVGMRLVDPARNTVAKISERLGPTRRTLQTWFREAEERNPDLVGRIMPRSQPRRYDRAAIRADLEAGEMTRAEIREKYGCSAKFLSQVATGLKPVEEEPFILHPVELSDPDAEPDAKKVPVHPEHEEAYDKIVKTKGRSKAARKTARKPREKRPQGRRKSE